MSTCSCTAVQLAVAAALLYSYPDEGRGVHPFSWGHLITHTNNMFTIYSNDQKNVLLILCAKGS